MFHDVEFLLTPSEEHAKLLGEKIKKYRLDMRWTRETFSRNTGVPVSTLRHFENTSQINLIQFIAIMKEVGDIKKLYDSINENQIFSIEELIAKPRQRGSR